MYAQYILNKRTFDNIIYDNSNNEYYSWLHGKIHYTVQGTGKPVLLIHGIYNGASNKEYENNINSLLENHTVYSIDLLGFGLSDKPNITYSPYMFISLINSFIEDVIKTKTSVVASGLSCNYVIMAFNFNPDNFKKLMFISPQYNKINSSFKAIENLIQLPIIGTSIHNIYSSKLFNRIYLKNKFTNSSILNSVVDNIYFSSHFGGHKCKYICSNILSQSLWIDITAKIKTLNIPTKIFNTKKNNNCTINTYCVSTKILLNYNEFAHIENSYYFNKNITNFFK